MPYARINMVEFESREEMHKVITNLNVNMKTVFPEIRSFVSVETSEKSQITISVYDHKEAADCAVAQRDTHLKHRELVDIFAHEGNVNCFYVEEEQLTHLLDGGL
ncbi:hypothetical protein pfor_37c3536 [Rhodobacteraceae bacterium SB2]|nr:hypothetical protein pfor_37c3536 [Rhodobacteraceae bacterium SB2]